MSPARWLVIGLLLAVVLAGCVMPGEGEDPLAQGVDTQAIIGGVTETGYRGVGCLVITEGAGAALCTGTHIGDGWVLTAAHCVEDKTAADVLFYLGSNVEDMIDGEFRNARSVHPHPDFSMRTLHADIALVNVRGISDEPSFIWNSEVPGGYGGHTVTWIGYGLNRTSPDEGDGTKRRGTGTIRMMDDGHFYYEFGTQGPCRGDSGGPALLDMDGEQRIAGVVSFGTDTDCVEFAADTRVDAFAPFIRDTIAGGTVDDCRITGGDCGGDACFPASEGFACFASDGRGVGASCNSDQTTWEALPCEDGSVCLGVSSSDPTEGECFAFCTDNGQCGAGEECVMPIFEDIDDVGVCAPERHECAITGGDCPDGQACYLTVDLEQACFPSDEIGLGASCNDDQTTWTNLPCDDGMVCLNLGAGGECVQFCTAPHHCAGSEGCRMPLFTGIDDIGFCTECPDGDGDGACTEGDCDDSDPNVYPGAEEACDGIDNDCDGDVDERCGDCTDDDGDGVCADEGDCDDSDASVNPDADEACDDGVDNDCDGDTDDDDTDCGGDGGGTTVESGCNCRVASAPGQSSRNLVVLALTALLGWLVIRSR